MLLAVLLLQATQPAAPPSGVQTAPEILIVARRRRCDVSVANHILSDREFAARAADWAAGEPLRVVTARGVGYKCLAKIAFRLNDHGVKRFVFVERAAPAPVTPQ